MSELETVGRQTALLIKDVRDLISAGRDRVARAVNQELITLYWHIGDRIRQSIVTDGRAEYGNKVRIRLAEQLTLEFGRGFSKASLSRMVRLTEIYTDLKIVATLSQQLTWSHFSELLPIKDDLERDFYAEMCRVERWSVRTLRSKIDGMLYQRTALSRKPDQLIRTELDTLRAEDKLTPDLVFRDPYFLDFLGLENTYSENDAVRNARTIAETRAKYRTTLSN